MLQAIGLSLFQGGVYSSFLGFTYKTVVNPEWDLQKLPYLVGFWTGLVVPSGIAWSFANNKMFSVLNLPRDPINMIRTINKKFIVADVFMNHIVYQVFLTYYLNFMFGLVNYEKTSKTSLKANPSAALKNINDHYKNIAKDLILTRVKITVASLLIDMWASRFVKSYKTGSKWVYLKNNLVNLTWHTYILYKVEDRAPLEPLPTSDAPSHSS